jgi:hypothetical protein
MQTRHLRVPRDFSGRGREENPQSGQSPHSFSPFNSFVHHVMFIMSAHNVHAHKLALSPRQNLAQRKAFQIMREQ